VSVTAPQDGGLEVRGTTAQVIGETAASAGLVLHELAPHRGSLEDSYMSLTADAVEYHATGGPSAETTPQTAPVPGARRAPNSKETHR
jgi:ABC-2 type transport system ATP-binding protein